LSAYALLRPTTILPFPSVSSSLFSSDMSTHVVRHLLLSATPSSLSSSNRFPSALLGPFAAHTQRLYNALFQRNSVYISTIFATAFGFSIGFDMLTSNIYDRLNQGVSRSFSLEEGSRREGGGWGGEGGKRISSLADRRWIEGEWHTLGELVGEGFGSRRGRAAWSELSWQRREA
jgi:ubiquinol-cytochrome c reductase subunit 9